MNISTKKGYTLLFSVIVASVVLAIAVFIIQTSRKQILLSSVWRDSTKAFYAAESGLQCAIRAYSDNLFDDYINTNSKSFACNGKDTSYAFDAPIISEGNTVYKAVIPSIFIDEINSCFEVEVNVKKGPDQTIEVIPENCVRNEKDETDPNWYCKNEEQPYMETIPGSVTMKLTSRGYNIADEPNCPANHPRALERAVNVQYKY